MKQHNTGETMQVEEGSVGGGGECGEVESDWFAQHFLEVIGRSLHSL